MIVYLQRLKESRTYGVPGILNYMDARARWIDAHVTTQDISVHRYFDPSAPNQSIIVKAPCLVNHIYKESNLRPAVLTAEGFDEHPCTESFIAAADCAAGSIRVVKVYESRGTWSGP